MIAGMLPSPCGGELHLLCFEMFDHAKELPSPCGGELHQRLADVESVDLQSYRPLAGVSCIWNTGTNSKSSTTCYRPLAGVSCISKNCQKIERVTQLFGFSIQFLWGKSKSFLKKQGKKPRKALFSCAYPLKMSIKTMPETGGRRSRAGLPDKKQPKNPPALTDGLLG